MRIATLSLCLTLLFVMFAVAQDGYPLPDDLQPITTENAAHIKPLASVGGVLHGGLYWSPDGEMLLATTSAGLQLYNVAQLQQPPIKIEGITNIFFNDKGELIVDGQQRDVHTGELMTTNPSATRPFLSPSGKIEVTARYKKDETVIDLKRASGETTSLSIDSSDLFSQIIFSPDEQYAVIAMKDDDYEYTPPNLSLWNTTSGELIAQLQSSLSLAKKIQFLGDGKLIVATDYYHNYDGTPENVVIWNGHTGERISPRGPTHGPVYFSPDNKLMVLFDWDRIEMWTDHLLGLLPKRDSFPASDGPPFAFSPDGNTFAKTDEKGIELWDVPTQTIPDSPRLTIRTANTVTKLVYSPDGSLLVSDEWNSEVERHNIEMWDALTGIKQQVFPSSDALSLLNPVFSKDGRFLRVFEWDDEHRFVWDIKLAKQIASLPHNPKFSEDGLRAAYWDDGWIRVVDLQKNQQTDLPVIENYLGPVAAFNSINHMAIFARAGIVGYDLKSRQEVLRQTYNERIQWPQFSADGSHLITFSKPKDIGDNTEIIINVWHISDLQNPLAQIKTSSSSRWRDWQLSPDGTLLSERNEACESSLNGGTYVVRNASTGEAFLSHVSDDCGPFISTFSPENKWLLMAWSSTLDVVDIDKAIQENAAGKKDGDLKSIKVMYDVGSVLRDKVEKIIFSPDGATVAFVNILGYDFGGPDFSYRITLFKFSDLLAQHDNPLTDEDNDKLAQAALTIPDVQTAIFSPDGRWLLTDVGLWDLAMGKQVASFASKIAVFSPDSSILATYNQNTNKVMLWDVSKLVTGDESPITTLEISKRRQGYQDELAFSPDAQLLYLKREGDIQIWGVPNK